MWKICKKQVAGKQRLLLLHTRCFISYVIYTKNERKYKKNIKHTYTHMKNYKTKQKCEKHFKRCNWHKCKNIFFSGKKHFLFFLFSTTTYVIYYIWENCFWKDRKNQQDPIKCGGYINTNTKIYTQFLKCLQL